MIAIFTARKRSLGQGNIFQKRVSRILATGGVPGPGGSAPVGCLVPGGSAPEGSALGGCLLETPPRTATAAGGTHPTGMHSCSYCCGKVSTSLIKYFKN